MLQQCSIQDARSLCNLTFRWLRACSALRINACRALVCCNLITCVIVTASATSSGNRAMEPRRDLFVSQLARKHPVAFFRLLDRCAREKPGFGVVDHAAGLAKAGSCRVGTKGLADLLSSPAATAALGSALCSMQKAHTTCPSLLPPQLLQQLSSSLAPAAPEAAAAAAAAAAGPAGAHAVAFNSSRVAQAQASAVMLLVLIARGVVAFHNATAHKPELALAEVEQVADSELVVCQRPRRHAMHGSLRVFSGMWQALQTLGVLTPTVAAYQNQPADSAAAAAQPTADAAYAAAPSDQASSPSSSSSTSGAGVRCHWQYLLRLHESRKLAAAAAAFSARWSQDEVQSVLQRYQEQSDAVVAVWRALTMEEKQALDDSGEEEIPTDVVISDRELLQRQQIYRDALVFCRTLVAVAPLPVVCNNPGCGELSGVSEAAAARYVCAGCGCRYCSAACQAAGWRGHKKACRRMAACGLKV
jgi:hypothetical protein